MLSDLRTRLRAESPVQIVVLILAAAMFGFFIGTLVANTPDAGTLWRWISSAIIVGVLRLAIRDAGWLPWEDEPRSFDHPVVGVVTGIVTALTIRGYEGSMVSAVIWGLIGGLAMAGIAYTFRARPEPEAPTVDPSFTLRDRPRKIPPPQPRPDPEPASPTVSAPRPAPLPPSLIRRTRWRWNPKDWLHRS